MICKFRDYWPDPVALDMTTRFDRYTALDYPNIFTEDLTLSGDL